MGFVEGSPTHSENTQRYAYAGHDSCYCATAIAYSVRPMEKGSAEPGKSEVGERSRVPPATSTFNFTAAFSPVVFSSIGGRRVHSRTLLLSGSPDATPSGKRSRRSRHVIWDLVPNGLLQAAVAPMAAAIARKERLVMVDIGGYPYPRIYIRTWQPSFRNRRRWSVMLPLWAKGPLAQCSRVSSGVRKGVLMQGSVFRNKCF